MSPDDTPQQVTVMDLPKSVTWTADRPVDDEDYAKTLQVVGWGRALEIANRGNTFAGVDQSQTKYAKRRAKSKVAKQSRKKNRSN